MDAIETPEVPPIEPQDPAPDAPSDEAPPPDAGDVANAGPRMVPEQRLDRLTRQREDERRRADALETRLKAIEEENARYRQALFDKMEHASEGQGQTLPPLDEDPQNLAQHMRLTQRGLVELAEQTRRAQAEAMFQQRVMQEVAQAKAKHADYDAAYRHAFNTRVQWHAHLGPERAYQAALAEERAFIERCHQDKVNPAEEVVELAKRFGYRPAAPDQAQEAQVRARAQKEASGLPKGGAQAQSAASFANLTQEQFNQRRKEFFAKNPGASTVDWANYYNQRSGNA